MKGRFYLAQRTRESVYKALDQFNQAVAKDPNYAQAYAGLAYAYVLLFDRGWISPEEASPKIRSAAQRAIELDPTLAEPHAALAVLKELADWDWAGAEAEYRKAIGLNPNDTTSHHWYALLLQNLGRLKEALAEIEKALALLRPNISLASLPTACTSPVLSSRATAEGSLTTMPLPRA